MSRIEHFEIGEVAIIVEVPREFSALIGTECTIEGPLATYRCHSNDPYEVRICPNAHKVSTVDGRRLAIDARCLRKKKPPQEFGSWSTIAELTKWNAMQVKA